MQTSNQSETPPLAEVAQGPATVRITGADGKSQVLEVPKTAAEVAAIVDQRRLLSEQLQSATYRRNQLSSEIGVSPDGVARTGLEDRIRVLDQRIVQLENDLSATGRQLSGAPAEMVAAGEAISRPPNQGDEWVEGMFVGGFFVLAGLGVVYAWKRFRRRKNRKSPAPATTLASDSTDRLERLERGMEAIAIEIERVSEGQRFVTRLLSESATPMGVSHRIAQPEQQPVRSSAGPTL